jgi:uncharacterized protein YlxW (UPF0749 family)
MNENEGLTGWILAGVGTIVSTLAGLVAMFYRTQIADYKANESGLRVEVVELRKRADTCEEDREQLRIKVAVMDARLDKVEQEVKRQGDL